MIPRYVHLKRRSGPGHGSEVQLCFIRHWTSTNLNSVGTDALWIKSAARAYLHALRLIGTYGYGRLWRGWIFFVENATTVAR